MLSTENDRCKMPKVKAQPVSPVVKTGTVEKIFGKFISVDVPDEPKTGAERDLVGDVFFSNYKHTPTTVEKVPDERLINKAVMDWLLENPSWSNADSAGNIPSSIASSGTLWMYLQNSAVIKEALEKQKKVEEEKNKANELRKQAIGTEDDETFRQLMAEANKHADAAKELAEAAVESLVQKKEDKLAKASITTAIKKSNEAGNKVANFVKSWGRGQSESSFQDAEEIVKYASDSRMQKLAELIGRAFGVGEKTIESAKKTIIKSVSEYRTTKRLPDMTFLQRMFLSPLAPDNIRMAKTAKWLSNGLFGVVPIQTPNRRGASIHILDGSGSMGHNGIAMEKSIAFGTVTAIRNSLEKDRYYELYEFSSSHRIGGGNWSDDVSLDIDFASFPSVLPENSLMEHIRWASGYLNGGTDFDAAFTLACSRLQAVADMGVDGCDLVFYSDGICALSAKKKAEFERIKVLLSVRMIFIQFGNYPNKDVKDLADVFIQLPSPEQIDLEELAHIIAQISSEHYLTGFGD